MTDKEFMGIVCTLAHNIEALKTARSYIWDVEDLKYSKVMEGIKRQINMGIDFFSDELIDYVKKYEDNGDD